MKNLMNQFFDIFDIKNVYKNKDFKHVISLNGDKASFLINYLNVDKGNLFSNVDKAVLNKEGYVIDKVSNLTGCGIKYVLKDSKIEINEEKDVCKKCNGNHYYYVKNKEVQQKLNKKLEHEKVACMTCNGDGKIKCNNCDGLDYKVCNNCKNTNNCYDVYGKQYSCNCSTSRIYNTNGFCKNNNCHHGYVKCPHCINGYHENSYYKDYYDDVEVEKEEKVKCDCADKKEQYTKKEIIVNEFLLKEVVELNIHNKLYKVVLGKDNIDMFNIKKTDKNMLPIKEIIYEFVFTYKVVDIFESDNEMCFIFDKEVSKTIIIEKNK